jgi:hypothetical protein
MSAAVGVPYHRAVQGPDGKWNWAECPRCGEIVRNRDGYGPARHWTAAHAAEGDPMAELETHRQHSDTPDESDPARPGRRCGPHCDLYQNPDPMPAGLSPAEEMLAETLTDAIDRWLAASAEVAEAIHATERLVRGTPLGEAARRFAAFHLGELEGTQAGWLGDFAVDALRGIRDATWATEAPASGYDPDPLIARAQDGDR